MGSLIKPGEIKIVTQNNELLVNIALESNIKLDGNITNLNISSEVPGNNDKVNTDNEKVSWAIPDFTSGNKINFGK